MEFKLDCPCGAKIRVTTADAGGMKRCRCGHDHVVPSLSELRRQAGHERYEVKIVDKVRRMVSDGTLPGSSNCAKCGANTSVILDLSIECERPYTKGRGFWSTVFLGMFAPVWVLVALLRDYNNPEVHGCDLVVDTPIPLWPYCASSTHKQTKLLRELIRTVPLYEQLLQEYPNAAIIVSPHRLDVA
jgi:hypothetical protein